MTEGVCECGCGETTTVVKYAMDGFAKGQHRRFRLGHYQRTATLPVEERMHRKREGDRRSDLKKLYGMTVEEWEDLYRRQGGCCAICGTDACPTGKRLSVDHVHETGKIRGLLCMRCNTAIGHIEKTKQGLDEWIERAHIYLKGI